MTAVSVTARCLGCDLSPTAGDWRGVDRQAERHTEIGHPTATTAAPGDRRRQVATATEGPPA